MGAQPLTNHDIRFTDHAAARAFELGLDHFDVIAALESGHFKQAAQELGRFIHYVKVGRLPLKVVTGPLHADPSITAIITVMALDTEEPTERTCRP